MPVKNGVLVYRGSGLVVSMLAFYSDDPSLNPAKNNFFCKMLFENNKKTGRGCLIFSIWLSYLKDLFQSK